MKQCLSLASIRIYKNAFVYSENIPQRRLGDDGMRDIILLVAVLAYMIGGYFVVGKIGDFIDENYKGYDYEIESDDKNDEND